MESLLVKCLSSSAGQLQEMLILVKKALNERGIKFIVRKMKCMVFERGEYYDWLRKLNKYMSLCT